MKPVRSLLAALVVACSYGPTGLGGGASSFALLSAGTSYTCGLTVGGVAYCWGYNAIGQLGVGDTAQGSRPRPCRAGLC